MANFPALQPSQFPANPFGAFGTLPKPNPAQERVQRGFDNGSITAGERLILDRMANTDREAEQRMSANGLNLVERGLIRARQVRYEATRALFERVDISTSSSSAEQAEQMRGLDELRARRQRGQLAGGVQNGSIDTTEFQRLNDFARGTEAMRAGMREGGYTSAEREQIEARLREYDRLARLFGETSGRAGQDRVRPETNRLVEQTRTENLFFGAPTLERDHAVARGRAVVERNGTIFSDERLDVRRYHQSQETRLPSHQVDPNSTSRATGEPFTPRQDLGAFQAQLGQIDSDHDGRVTRRELEQALRDPRFRGDRARLLAATHQGFDQFSSTNPTASFGSIGGVQTESSIAISEFDPAQRESESYRTRLETLNSIEQRLAQRGRGNVDAGLFGAEGRPDPNSIRQGMANDCWYLASMGAMTPDQLGRMIQQREDGQYEVSFPGRTGRPPIVVAPPTDAERYLGVHANGDWAGVLQRAGDQAARAGDMGNNDHRIRNGLNWGNSTEAYRLFTGQEGTFHQNNDMTRTSDIGDLIARSQSEGRLVTAYSPDRQSPDNFERPQSIGNHVYTVVGYDQRTGMVTVRNPWGANETADRDGKDDGVFQMPLSEFHASFPTMVISDPVAP